MTNETPKPKPKFKLKIPIAQKQQLYQAIVTLFTVVLGIVLTLSTQYMSSEFGLPQESPVNELAEFADPILGLGTTHFTDIAADSFTGAVVGNVTGNVDGDLTGNVTGNVTGDLTGHITAAINTENVGLPTVVTTPFTWTVAAGVTGTVATIPDGEIWLVHAVFISVTTDFDCTGDDTTLIVGDGSDTDGFVVLADAELQIADTEQTGSPAGWQGLVAATMGVYLDGAVSSAPHIYAPSGADETIDFLLDEASGETITAGAATIYVVYTRIQ